MRQQTTASGHQHGPAHMADMLARLGTAMVIAWAFSQAVVGMAGEQVLTIDPANSRVAIDVGRTGVFGFAGHNHEVLAPAVSGRVSYDPADWPRSSVSLTFDASALQVTGKGDPPSDVPKVQQAMLSDEVLDVKRYPTVEFRSRRLAATPRGPNAVDLVIDGDLTLHGVTRPISVRSTASLESNGITVRGAFPLKQTDFGMQPVTAGGGTVRVKDEVNVQFVLRASPAGGDKR